MDEVVGVVDVLGSLVARTDNDFLVVVEVGEGDALDLLAHCGGEKEGVALGGHTCQDFVDALREAHVEHLVGLVEHHVFDVLEAGHTAVHQVDEATRRGHNHLHATTQGADLALDARTAIDGQHVEAVNVAGVLLEVVGNLEAELAGGTEDHGLRGAALGVDLLEDGQTEGRRLARTCLCQGNDIVAHTEEVGDYFFLYGHRIDIPHFADGAANLFADAQFFKCLQDGSRDWRNGKPLRGIKNCHKGTIK